MRQRKGRLLSWAEAIAFCKTWPSEELDWRTKEFDFGNGIMVVLPLHDRGVASGDYTFRRAIAIYEDGIFERELRLARLKMLERVWNMRARYAAH